jgi:protein-S-isoprenylcysteine O-methyltransferase Ste14
MTFQHLITQELIKKALLRVLAGIAILAAMFFLPAGTLFYWEAWVYLGILFIPMLFVLFYLIRREPDLLERRLRAKEKEAEQKRIVTLFALYFLAVFLLPGFDHRYGWSDVPVPVVLVADLIILLGYGFFVLVLLENRYASRTIEVEAQQPVITTGPYAWVRHPMYLAVLIMYIFSPLALGSYWAVLLTLPLIALLVARIRNEEKVLLRELAGYEAYLQATRYRLIPGVW